jgi:hypothetical protein
MTTQKVNIKLLIIANNIAVWQQLRVSALNHEICTLAQLCMINKWFLKQMIW